MESCLAYEPCVFEDDFFQAFSLDRVKDALNSIRIKIGDFVVDILGFENHREDDVFQDNVDVFDIEKKIKNEEYSYGYALSQSEINKIKIKHRQEMLDQSFSECFDDANDDRDVFSPVYELLKGFVQSLDFEDCVVNASRKRERVDFNLFFDGGLFVSIAQGINSDENDDVMFSVSRNKKKIIISKMNIHELMEIIKKLKKSRLISLSIMPYSYKLLPYKGLKIEADVDSLIKISDFPLARRVNISFPSSGIKGKKGNFVIDPDAQFLEDFFKYIPSMSMTFVDDQETLDSASYKVNVPHDNKWDGKNVDFSNYKNAVEKNLDCFSNYILCKESSYTKSAIC